MHEQQLHVHVEYAYTAKFFQFFLESIIAFNRCLQNDFSISWAPNGKTEEGNWREFSFSLSCKISVLHGYNRPITTAVNKAAWDYWFEIADSISRWWFFQLLNELSIQYKSVKASRYQKLVEHFQRQTVMPSSLKYCWSTLLGVRQLHDMS